MDNYIFPFLWMRGEPEEVLRREMARIAECGIGAVCVEARPHDDFCGPGWWHDMDIVLDEARQRDMKVWILDDKHFPTGYANGLIEQKYPERKKRYVACTTSDIFGSDHLLNLNVNRMLKPTIGFWEIGKPVNEAERANNRLLSLAALRFVEGRRFAEEAVDLTDSVGPDGFARFSLPAGQWRVFALYHTRTDGGNEAYINMIDSVSAHTQIEGVYEAHYARYGADFGKTIAGFFSDEPQFGNIFDQDFDTRLGKAKMPLPWSDELEEMLRERWGDRLNALLPLLFAESAEGRLGPQLRYDYMDCVSRLYAKCFARPIGDWCRAHGVEYIGHVVEDNGVHSRLGLGAAHWFRAMEGQDMAGVDIIGGQYYFGAPNLERKAMTPCDGEFFHYTLGKLGASGGHLDPKKKGRTMCELFGAYGWSFGVREMKHLLDHLLSRGVNHLVPHAFSMAQYPDPDCPPHFYAGGHNPEFPFFGELMRYANRMCHQLNGGTHAASVAVLYDGELDWAGDHMPMQKLGRVLTEHQIEYDIVPMDMLRDLAAYHGCVAEGKLQINGVVFGALLVPWTRYAPAGLAKLAQEHPDFPIFFMDALPEALLKDGPDSPEALPETVKALALENVPEALEAMGLRPLRAEPAFPCLTVYHYLKPDGARFFLLNESPDRAFEGTLRLPAALPLARYDGFADRWESVSPSPAHGSVTLSLRLEPGEACLLAERADAIELPIHHWFRAQAEACGQVLDLSEGWHMDCVTALGETVLSEDVKALPPVEERLPAFSGTVRYTRTLELDRAPEIALFRARHVYEVLRLTVNGKAAGVRLTPPYQIDLKGLLRQGTNELCVEVANTPMRDQANYPAPPFDFTIEALEPTGMFGRVELRYI